MTKVQCSVQIERPIEEVFAYVCDPDNDTMWQTAVVEIHRVGDGVGPMGLGDEAVEVCRFLGKRIETRWTVTEDRPPTRSAIASKTGPIPFAGSYDLASVDGGTRFTMTMETDAHGFFRLAEPVFARIARREMQANSDTLKDLLEAGVAGAAVDTPVGATA